MTRTASMGRACDYSRASRWTAAGRKPSPIADWGFGGFWGFYPPRTFFASPELMRALMAPKTDGAHGNLKPGQGGTRKDQRGRLRARRAPLPGPGPRASASEAKSLAARLRIASKEIAATAHPARHHCLDPNAASSEPLLLSPVLSPRNCLYTCITLSA